VSTLKSLLETNSFLGALGINLFSAFIGFGIARLYMHLKTKFSKRAITSFWAPNAAPKIIVYCGAWEKMLSELGELEQVINAQVALTLAELRLFLESYYPEVVITTDRKSIDWRFPVVSLGGPLASPLTKEIGEKGLLPIWFRDMPYSESSRRSLTNSTQSESFTSEFDDGQLVSDVGFIARLKSPEQPTQFLYIIAANYGCGNWGVVRHMTSARNVGDLRKICKSERIQAIIRTRVARNDILETRLLNCRDID